jgi:hypothetical protein
MSKIAELQARISALTHIMAVFRANKREDRAAAAEERIKELNDRINRLRR